MKNQFLKLKVISPMFLGGSNHSDLDKPAILRPPTIRGHLHFWIRALAGGKLQVGENVTQEQLREIRAIEEAMLGGTTFGQKMAFYPPDMPSGDFTGNIDLLPGHNFERNIIKPDSTMILRFRSEFVLPDYLPLLKAAFWVWLNLGSIGKRSRRGLGSIEWLPSEGDFLDGFIEPPQPFFKEINTLSKYLEKSLDVIGQVWDIDFSKPREIHPYFCLSSKTQVFVGNVLTDNHGAILDEFNNAYDGIIGQLHGISNDASGEGEELGHSGGKLASPMIWRVHRCQGGFVPVMSWSPKSTKSIQPGTGVYNYLTNMLGFQNSLQGKAIWEE